MTIKFEKPKFEKPSRKNVLGASMALTLILLGVALTTFPESAVVTNLALFAIVGIGVSRAVYVRFLKGTGRRKATMSSAMAIDLPFLNKTVK